MSDNPEAQVGLGNIQPMVSEEQFEELLKSPLGDSFVTAQDLYLKYGVYLTFDVTNSLMHAVDKGKVPEVLAALQEHYNQSLHYDHPEIRGLIAGPDGFNSTQAFFVNVYEGILGLEPDTEQSA